ncbi:ribonuclease R [Desulfosediminicola flagellatus]|uniref:ribonuclease R n=1 Tax=Desulfosediminicola flagellatus TaxID=2569541 RepID=UPI00142EC2FF|nr:ribonuclease R [Desulfosediminicola flagellatus]
MKRRGKPPFGAKDKKRTHKNFALQAIENSVLHFLFGCDSPASLTDIATAVTGKRTISKDLKLAIAYLFQSKAIIKPGKKHYQIGSAAQLYSGTLHQHPKGFGFVSITKKHGSSPDLDRDVHIPANRISKAMHGDTVLIRVVNVAKNGKAEGAILDVIERGPETIAGFFTRDKKGAFVFPEDTRYPFIIRIDPQTCPDIENGMAVIAKITPPDQPSRTVAGSITEILGPPEHIDVQMRLVTEKFQLPHQFSDATVAEAEKLSDTIPTDEAREDLRDIQLVTIDGETAKDFDDAVCVLRTDTGYRLYVSIADVSYFVKPGSAIDKDAYQRGTSIYFPGRVIPMLPEKLSNNLCSLIPDQDRLAVTAVIDFDNRGNRIGKRFCRSIIRSHKRFTYTTVRQILIDKDPAVISQHTPFLEMLGNASELATLLQRYRTDRGSIGFSIPEPEISLDHEGKIASIKKAERNFAHQLIEEFMLAANEAVAETFTRNHRNSLYRIHELPDFEKVVEFSHFAKTLDLHLPPPENNPQWFGKVLEACKGTPKEYIVNNLLLRTMQQARYSHDNKGHFALAATDYTHFTSPIRRYPDLMVHRELCRFLLTKKQTDTDNIESQNLEAAGIFLSTRERTAVNSEREMNDRLKIIYMEKHLGESFSAIISGVTEFAFFVELDDLFISGSILAEQLTDDYYLYDGKHHRLIGEISRNIYQLGDRITVIATDIDKNKNRVNFKPSLMQ